MVGCVGNALTLVLLDIRFTGGSRSLRGYQPEIRKVARRLGAAPSPRSFGDSAAQAGARCVVGIENWSGQPDLHRHRLIGTQASCS